MKYLKISKIIALFFVGFYAFNSEHIVNYLANNKAILKIIVFINVIVIGRFLYFFTQKKKVS